MAEAVNACEKYPICVCQWLWLLNPTFLAGRELLRVRVGARTRLERTSVKEQLSTGRCLRGDENSLGHMPARNPQAFRVQYTPNGRRKKRVVNGGGMECVVKENFVTLLK